MKNETKYLYLLTLVYFAVSLVGILHHELWLDESHHWLLARDSNSVAELIQNMRIEGHPLTWSLLLYGITRFTSNPFWMQFLHILISTATVFLFLKKAPFPWIFKALFIFGYFMVFEYNLISRNYILGLFFLFLACSLFENRSKNFIWICVFLALAANVHLMFSIIAFALFLTLLLEHFDIKTFFSPAFLIGCFIFGIGLLLLVIQIAHTDSGWFLNPINALPFGERLIKGYVSFFKGTVALPDFRTIHFWNSNLLVNSFRKLSAVLALLVYLVPLLLFYKNKKTLFLVYSGLVGTQVFFFITQRSATRFHGMTFIIIIMALWIEHFYKPENSKLKEFLKRFNLVVIRKPFIYSILIIHFCSGICAYAIDYKYPFTAAEETVAYLKNKGWENKEIVTISCDGTLLSAYLQRRVYFLCESSYQSFCHWDNGCSRVNTKKEAMEILCNYAQTHDNIVFITYDPLPEPAKANVWSLLDDKTRIRFVKKFGQTIMANNDCYIYEVQKIKP